MTVLLVEPAAERSPSESVSIAQAAIALCRSSRAAVLATTIVHGPALLLGARQRSARFESGTPCVVRRTTGREARVEGIALHHVLALPALDALARDARPENFLNRCVRGFLVGYRSLGLRADYLGRDVIRLDRKDSGRLGYDFDADGVGLLELIVALERTDAAEAAQRVASGLATSYGLVERRSALPAALPWRVEELPASCSLASVSVPIGVVEAAVSLVPRPEVWLGGDLLSSTAALAAAERNAEGVLAAGRELDESILAPILRTPLDGARPEDLLAALLEAAKRAAAL